MAPNVRRMYVTLRVAAVLLWVPHSLALMYVVATTNTTTATSSISRLFYVLTCSLFMIAVTYYVAVYKQCGEYLLIISWLFGVLSEEAWAFMFPDTVAFAQRSRPTFLSPPVVAGGGGTIVNAGGSGGGVGDHDSPRLLWIAVSMLQGIVGGILCKLKDIDEDRYYPTHAIGERLYVVVPFCTGQWLSFIIQNGWRGIIVENLTILLSLAMVGYCVIGYKLLQEHTSLKRGDLIGFVEELLTTSFGVVFAVMLFGSIFVTLLAIPFLKSLFSLNALVSSAGIILEYIVYEVALKKKRGGVGWGTIGLSIYACIYPYIYQSIFIYFICISLLLISPFFCVYMTYMMYTGITWTGKSGVRFIHDTTQGRVCNVMYTYITLRGSFFFVSLFFDIPLIN
ncbi:hypothetical protein MOQ_009986 [Trypanosoma cruzi marinkellei]|uniref:Uncharacterized protein n=1 Tax=Trypanosoma cruzi marinkellei TaxID=85056 RepID=K2MGR5_TRYCR|nr:hypothetical protein MOQ_009986 [Trypanosoma cruzi marinkellei]